jgi:putative oxidoreductase
MKNKVYIQFAITIMLLLLWIPALLDKLLQFGTFQSGILKQPFSDELGYMLIYSLPILEMAIVILLVSSKYRWMGFVLSSFLMMTFTGYIAIALMGAWDKIPCGCGSVISSMSWKQHLWFNLFFLAISLVGFIVSIKLRIDGSYRSSDIVENSNT